MSKATHNSEAPIPFPNLVSRIGSTRYVPSTGHWKWFKVHKEIWPERKDLVLPIVKWLSPTQNCIEDPQPKHTHTGLDQDFSYSSSREWWVWDHWTFEERVSHKRIRWNPSEKQNCPLGPFSIYHSPLTVFYSNYFSPCLYFSSRLWLAWTHRMHLRQFWISSE